MTQRMYNIPSKSKLGYHQNECPNIASNRY